MHLAPGNILIATSLMDDPFFEQAMVLLNQESAEGMYGYLLNQPLALFLHEIDNNCRPKEVQIYNGGPVGLDELGFVHCRYDLFPESKILTKDLCWGGYFDKLVDNLNWGNITTQEFKIFKGYCGWDINQILEETYHQKCWELVEYKRQIVF